MTSVQKHRTIHEKRISNSMTSNTLSVLSSPSAIKKDVPTCTIKLKRNFNENGSGAHCEHNSDIIKGNVLTEAQQIFFDPREIEGNDVDSSSQDLSSQSLGQ